MGQGAGGRPKGWALRTGCTGLACPRGRPAPSLPATVSSPTGHRAPTPGTPANRPHCQSARGPPFVMAEERSPLWLGRHAQNTGYCPFGDGEEGRMLQCGPQKMGTTPTCRSSSAPVHLEPWPKAAVLSPRTTVQRQPHIAGIAASSSFLATGAPPQEPRLQRVPDFPLPRCTQTHLEERAT